jgi:hypothetical protein
MKKQGELFGISQNLPRGFVYQPEFISEVEETALLEEISVLPLHAAKYKEYTAKRRVIAYGGSYDFATNELVPAVRSWSISGWCLSYYACGRIRRTRVRVRPLFQSISNHDRRIRFAVKHVGAGSTAFPRRRPPVSRSPSAH